MKNAANLSEFLTKAQKLTEGAAKLNEILTDIEQMTTGQAIVTFCAILTQKAEQLNLKDDEIPAFVEYIVHHVANI